MDHSTSNIARTIHLATAAIWLGVAITSAPAATTFTDNFSTSLNYLTNGVKNTIWDGVYFGADEFNNTGVGPSGLGQTLVCNANTTAANTLTVQSTATDWEHGNDDGFFLFKVVQGDFSAMVRIVTPFNASAYNTAGLQARAFGPGGDAPGGSENYVSWTRFNQYNYANYLRNEVNGTAQQINPGNYPNSAYWLRMDRVGNTFRFYQRTNSTDAWRAISVGALSNGTNLIRSDFDGQPLQVGIIHATFAGQLQSQFASFSLTETNMGPFAAVPSAATTLVLTTNGSSSVSISWSPGAGSSGSLVVVWPGTNSVVKQMPVDGFSYTGNAGYGLGGTLPAAGQHVVYAGPGSQVTVTNLLADATYQVAVFSYAGAGSTIAYNNSPLVGRVTLPPTQLVAVSHLLPPDVAISFSAIPGEWYWLQYTDTLTPPSWQNVLPGPTLANSDGMVIVHVNGATAAQRFYRLQQLDPLFTTKVGSGAITILERTGDAFATRYLSGGRLGDAILRYRQTGTNWLTAQTSTAIGIASTAYSTSPDGTQQKARYLITNGITGGPLVLESVLTFRQDAIEWTLNATNLSGQPVEIGDWALPLPMNSTFSGVTSSAMKHSHVAGHNSFVFWMRPNSVGPYLVFTPAEDTWLEYWDNRSGGAGNGYEVFIHSKAAGAIADSTYPAVTTQGGAWRLPHTSLMLQAGGAQTHGFKFQWAASYDGVRQVLVDEGKIDVHVVPGMTVPTNLFAQIALRTRQPITAVEAEHPAETVIQSLGTSIVGTNSYLLYQVQFARIGENLITVRYGNGQVMYLEFFATEPIETLIKKRAAYMFATQIITNRWYTGLFCDVNMNDGALITPDNHDTLYNSFQVYEIASDDAGGSRPAFLATKLAVFPVQSQVTALDYFISHFVWGGLQRSTNESSAYGIYGVPDWNTLRSNNTLGLGRGYDYPHIFTMYYGMYQVAKYHPEITTVLTAKQYLERAWGTAMALWTFGGGQATDIGLMNEMVIGDILDALEAEGMTSQAASLRTKWETKIAFYVSGQANLFGSEYAFDSTGFEAQQAYCKYALAHAGSSALMGSANPAAFLQNVTNFMQTQITANMFDRGWLETSYYYYGSDYRGDMGDDYVLSYMAQMGGWGLLDYALHYADNPTDYLRLGYASILSAWATINSGPPPNYGYWYPGAAFDGGAGGGFEPSPYNTTWLAGQPMHRGLWYYSAEQCLGFCGGVRGAATVLADDPIFGLFCYGGTLQQAGNLQVTPRDGVRRRFHALLNSGSLHLEAVTDRFAEGQPITLQPDLSQAAFSLETENPAAHAAKLRLKASVPGPCTVSGPSGTVATLNLQAGVEVAVDLPIPAGTSTIQFTVTR